MDIFSFINSKAIADHLRSIDYHFNALEAAWIVTECKGATLKEKHDAYVGFRMKSTVLIKTNEEKCGFRIIVKLRGF